MTPSSLNIWIFCIVANLAIIWIRGWGMVRSAAMDYENLFELLACIILLGFSIYRAREEWKGNV